MTPVRYEVTNGVAWLTIDRPKARNALSKAVREGLFEGVHRFNADDEAKVLVLTGAGEKAFCSGGDLKEMSDTALTIPPPDFLPQFGRNIDVPKPTIAAVNGLAYGGGFLIAQAERIAANAPLSVLAAKRTAYLSATHPRAQAYERAEDIWEPVYLSADAQEGPRAFQEKRAPVWKGR